MKPHLKCSSALKAFSVTGSVNLGDGVIPQRCFHSSLIPKCMNFNTWRQKKRMISGFEECAALRRLHKLTEHGPRASSHQTFAYISLIWLSFPKHTLQAGLCKTDHREGSAAVHGGLTCRLLSPGCRETLYRRPDLKRSADLTYPNRPSLTSRVRCTTPLQCYTAIRVFCSYTQEPPPPSFLLCSSVARGGHTAGTAAGMRGLISSVVLCKYLPDIHQQTIKIILQSSFTASACQLLFGVFSFSKSTPSIFKNKRSK